MRRPYLTATRRRGMRTARQMLEESFALHYAETELPAREARDLQSALVYMKDIEEWGRERDERRLRDKETA